MKTTALALLALLVAAAGWAAGDMAAHHQVVAADAVQWGPAPPALPAGSKAAVLAGDPSQDGPFTMRAWLPDGWRIAPHWHPTAENVTVISGTLHLGTGESFDAAKADALKTGGFASMPAEMRHYAWAEGDTVIQVHGTGPFALTYVNPADDPRAAPAAAAEE